MSRGLRVWTLAACAHLALATGGALGVALSGPGRLPGLSQYGFLSGADAGFSFFAPAVASNSRVTFTLSDAQGRSWNDTVFGDSATTWGLRSSAVSDVLSDLDDRLLRGVTGSWAALLFGRHPQATSLVVEVEVEGLPTMDEWRAGERSHWIPAYKATFERAETALAAGHDG